MQLKDAIKEIQTRPTVPLWPHVGLALSLSRGSVYAAARRNEIETIKVGHAIRAITAPLHRKLGLDAA